MDKIIKNKDCIIENLKYCPDTGEFWWLKRGHGRKFNRPAGYCNKQGYVVIKLHDYLYLSHRLAFLFMGEIMPEQVDHINGIKRDNRWCNLRPACPKTNQYNKGKGKNNVSGYKGVSFEKSIGKWRASIRIQGENTFLGRYDTPELAAEAYRVAANKYHGDYAKYE